MSEYPSPSAMIQLNLSYSINSFVMKKTIKLHDMGLIQFPVLRDKLYVFFSSSYFSSYWLQNVISLNGVLLY